MESAERKEFIPGVTEEINITPEAVIELKKLIKENNIPESYGLRIGVKGGGCSGMNYTLGFDAESEPTDNILNFDGLNVFIDMKSYLYLTGTELDFVDGKDGRGFTFNNPNAKPTCGCGSSCGE